MPKLRTILVDDEWEAREGLRALAEDDPDLEVVAVCRNGVEAIDAIHTHHPDLLLLDIQMPVVDGFEVLRSLQVPRLPAVIFVTAYDQYALKAFEVHAVDYLLKPFTDERFYAALTHAKQLIAARQPSGVEKLVQATAPSVKETLLADREEETRRMVIKADGRVHFVPLDDIIWIEAYDYYVKIHVARRFFLLRESMKRLDARLPDHQFVRIHKSSIVNVRFLQRLDPLANSEYEAVLTTGETLKVSRHYRDRLQAWLEGKGRRV
ncbi:two-component system, LytT family, response regulator [Catalinimonas alkaloidigena]|uniref:Two-component system, LytT family, response regulator n=1 Tax=Catalinimonas alkaloidigena TaxID=1075417 RepID=A0A1G9FAV8_9BACT|nr:LytTR family DNA-binding domain-containing protein [Catalinimonas alkaloidigena]SDK85506.1 two-component system, LytT family, response regulator [Catalinimonas alkaloidigena]